MKYRINATRKGWQSHIVNAQLRFNINWESEDAPNILLIAPLSDHAALRTELVKLRRWFLETFGEASRFVIVNIHTPFPPKKEEEPEEAGCVSCGAPVEGDYGGFCNACQDGLEAYESATRGEKSHLTRMLNERRRKYGWKPDSPLTVVGA